MQCIFFNLHFVTTFGPHHYTRHSAAQVHSFQADVAKMQIKGQNLLTLQGVKDDTTGKLKNNLVNPRSCL